MGWRANFLRDAHPERQQEVHWLDLQCSRAHTYVTKWDRGCEKRYMKLKRKIGRRNGRGVNGRQIRAKHSLCTCGRVNVKMAILLKMNYIWNASRIKVPITAFKEIEKNILNFLWKHKEPKGPMQCLVRIIMLELFQVWFHVKLQNEKCDHYTEPGRYTTGLQ